MVYQRSMAAGANGPTTWNVPGHVTEEFVTEKEFVPVHRKLPLLYMKKSN